MLALDHLSLAFDDNRIFDNLSFELAQGDIACLLGQSGCGKTSVLRCILGFETPQTGSIRLDDVLLFDDKTNVAAHKRQIGMVFQDYALFTHLTVADNIGFGLGQLDKASKKARIDELLALIDMSDYARRYPHELSGGQQQRVALARALAPRPKLILLDEPFSNLDVDLRAVLSKEIRQLLKTENTSAILVTHDQSEAFAFADYIGVIAQNQLQQWDTPVNLYEKPITQALARFIGDGSLLEVISYNAHSVTTALGQIPCANTVLAKNSHAKALVRPHAIDLIDHTVAEATAVLLDKQFLGANWRYLLELDGGEQIVVLADLARHDKLGAMLGLKANHSWLVD